jgi:hypothetical protein
LADKYKDVDIKSRNTIVTEYARLKLSRPSNADFAYRPAAPILAIDGLAI